MQPLLPPEPWYKSEVQWRAVIAIGAQVISIGLRMAERIAAAFGYTLGLSITATDIDGLVADATQAIAVVFALWAITKRSSSKVQPLTLTQAGADALREKMPPLLDVDPTKKPPST